MASSENVPGRNSTRVTALTAVAVLWFVTLAALAIAFAEGFDIEQLLATVFGPPRPPDQYEFVNSIALLLIPTLITWCALFAVYTILRRGLEAAALLGGVAVACGFAAPVAGDFSDPPWFTILSILFFGQFVSIMVSVVLFAIRTPKSPMTGNLCA